MSDQLERARMEWHVQEMEYLRGETNLEVSKRILEATRAGRPLDPKLIDLSGMKERYLEALSVYDSLGLTSLELFEKRLKWLLRPSDVVREDAHVKVPDRIKTVAMFLNRLQREGLARREKEEHTYRYFLTESGRRRLSWYKNAGKKRKTSENTEKWLDSMFWKNSAIIGDIKSRHTLIEASVSSPKISTRDVYDVMWKRMEDLLDSSLMVQLSLSNFINEDTVKSAVNDMTRSLEELQSMQNTLYILL